jgi:hypothetical protein
MLVESINYIHESNTVLEEKKIEIQEFMLEK